MRSAIIVAFHSFLVRPEGDLGVPLGAVVQPLLHVHLVHGLAVVGLPLCLDLPPPTVHHLDHAVGQAEERDTQRLFITYSGTILQKNVFFPHVRKFVLNSGPFCLLDSWPFGPYFCPFCHANFVLFSNARSILKLML